MGSPFIRPALVAGNVGGAPSGGASIPQSAVGAGTVSFSSFRGDYDDITAGRITLAVLDLFLILLLAFYVTTRSSQGGS
jgi:hypothetical protein